MQPLATAQPCRETPGRLPARDLCASRPTIVEHESTVVNEEQCLTKRCATEAPCGRRHGPAAPDCATLRPCGDGARFLERLCAENDGRFPEIPTHSPEIQKARALTPTQVVFSVAKWSRRGFLWPSGQGEPGEAEQDFFVEKSISSQSTSDYHVYHSVHHGYDAH
jgi:hypothetical protein